MNLGDRVKSEFTIILRRRKFILYEMINNLNISHYTISRTFQLYKTLKKRYKSWKMYHNHFDDILELKQPKYNVKKIYKTFLGIMAYKKKEHYEKKNWIILNKLCRKIEKTSFEFDSLKQPKKKIEKRLPSERKHNLKINKNTSIIWNV